MKCALKQEDYESEAFIRLNEFMNSKAAKYLFGVDEKAHFLARNPQVIETMQTDVMRSVAHYVSELLDAYIPVLSGTLGLTVCFPMNSGSLT